jgi:TM2 domain-containing membrane protein YozV
MNKKRLTTAILALFLGIFGAHRFYVGKIGTGILQLLTAGGFFIWCFIDFVLIIFGEFTDNNGNKINEWI